MLTGWMSIFHCNNFGKVNLKFERVQLDGRVALKRVCVYGGVYRPHSSSCASLKHIWLNGDCWRSSPQQGTHHLMAIFRRTIHHVTKLKTFKQTKVLLYSDDLCDHWVKFEMWGNGRFVFAGTVFRHHVTHDHHIYEFIPKDIRQL